MLSGCFLLIAVALVLLISGAGGWSFYAFAALFGLAYGLFIVSETAMPAELFGTKSLGTIMATLALFPMVGGAVGQTMAGFIFDSTGSYRVPFLICLAFAALAVGLGVPLMKGERPVAQLARSLAAGEGADALPEG